MADVQMNGIEFEVRSNAGAAAQGINELTRSLKQLRSATAGGLGLKSVAKESKSIMNAFAGFGKGITNLIGTPFRAMATGAKNISKSLGNVLSSLKRIAFYRVIRSAIREIGEAFSEGSKKAIDFSRTYGKATKYIADAMDGLSGSAGTMQGQLGAAWATLLAQIAPIISQIISLVTAAANAITQLFAILGGRSTYLKATNYTKDLAEQTKAGGSAAKEWRNQLMKFDELNRLDDQNGGGGGGGGGSQDGESLFEEMPVMQSIKDFVDDIKGYIAGADWEGLGKFLGQSINDLIDSIDWPGLGKKVGEFINALFTTTYWTLETINFRNIGNKVAEFLTGKDGVGGALRSIDTEIIGKLIARWFTILPEFIIGLIEKLDWKLVGQKVKGLITGFFDELTGWIKGIDWKKLTNTVIDGVIAFVKGLDPKSVAASIKEFILTAWDAAKTVFSTVWERVDGDKFIKKFKDWIDGLDISGAVSSFSKKFSGMFDSLATLTDGVDWVGIGNSIVKAITVFFDSLKIGDILDAISRFVKSIASGLNQMLGAIWEHIEEAMIEGFNALVDKFNSSDFSNWTGIKFKKLEVPVQPTLEDPPPSEVKKFVSNSHKKIKKESEKNPAQVDSEANMTQYKDDLSKRPNISSVSAFENWRQAFSMPSINSNANFTKKTSTINTVWDSTANFKKRSGSVDTTWESTAKFVKRSGSINTTWNSTAKFTDLDISKVPHTGNNLKFNATVAVTSVTGTDKLGSNVKTKAGGGVFRHGRWFPIQSFASGGSPFGGQLFRARENGNPELVGTIRGSTAVMNNDQIVASVSSGVARALSGLRFQLGGGGDSDSTENVLYRAMLRALNEADSEIYLDGAVVYSKMLDRNRQETRRTGVNQMTYAY